MKNCLVQCALNRRCIKFLHIRELHWMRLTYELQVISFLWRVYTVLIAVWS